VGRLPPKVIAATTLVAVAPAGVVWGLRAAGIVGAFLPCAALGALLSLVTCSAAARLWERSDRAGDVLFGDLMIWGWIRRCHQERRLADAASLLGARRAPGATDPLSLSIERRTRLLEQLAADLEAGDPYTHGHSRRVARYATLIAKRMGVSGDELARIRLAAALHDVGKLETPTAVLHKPGRLTNSEFAIVREHPVTGAEMVSILEDPELSEIVLHHHERLDGTGYPDRLPGDQIPLGARIISVADTFDAITSARPYRAARPDAARRRCRDRFLQRLRRPEAAFGLGRGQRSRGAAADLAPTRRAWLDRARGGAGGERGGGWWRRCRAARAGALHHARHPHFDAGQGVAYERRCPLHSRAQPRCARGRYREGLGPDQGEAVRLEQPGSCEQTVRRP
jgi:putative nucleotidyltransferase with HDIG domain